jgi:hypothetical protein
MSSHLVKFMRNVVNVFCLFLPNINSCKFEKVKVYQLCWLKSFREEIVNFIFIFCCSENEPRAKIICKNSNLQLIKYTLFAELCVCEWVRKTKELLRGTITLLCLASFFPFTVRALTHTLSHYHHPAESPRKCVCVCVWVSEKGEKIKMK